MAPEEIPPGSVAIVREGLSAADAEAGLLALAALGIPATMVDLADGTHGVAVGARDRDRAGEILDLADADRASQVERERRRDLAESAVRASRSGFLGQPWFARDTLVVPVLVALCSLVYLVVSGVAAAVPWERMVRAGAISQRELEQGEIWRLASAVFLHFDLEHLLSNMATLLFVGPILAREVGPMRFLAVFLLSGIAGNVTSWTVSPPLGLRAGASGGVAGIIGALAGEALSGVTPRRFARWQVLGALAAVYALLVGAGPRSDHVAHLAGLLAGIGLGRAFAPRPADDGSDEATGGPGPRSLGTAGRDR